LSRRLRIVREENILPWARPDGKTQVTVAYNEDGSVHGVDTVVVAIQHDKHLKDQFGGSIDAELEHVRQSIIEHVVEVTIPQELLLPNYKLIVNGTGRFADPGGPYADAGLTGRKIIVDTYGGMGRHGGGAFSGKDPSKVDRSAAYAARWAAKHVVAAGLATKFEIQLAYVIGVAEPVSLMVDSFGTGVLSDEVLAERVKATFDFRPAAIARDLDLLRPIYKETSSGGHFGRPPTDAGHFPWERIDSGRIENLLQS
ncbi:MAG: methionine adenosyltransferase domain-containing protein, partial [Candidatus Thermoplasmatota archaeon]|nr:methionine adenosyltransferase domain-containing protein [Candidatus Thermoplasmatota archaeon]